ncbi:P-loop containing nucleoside triphosphate hydrolase [Pseudocohnilembus persalinus]|uniref:Kinesin-like protein n=1 Tax=Pseudocohnilembus persalinus TaxID=266149 RepID=A0A0V0QEZ2_PSEPJ|nr:P-loop containing nucleoside triphosphate hydrolase [Pseudocohnilembus persalinus]|eukprot:KRX00715.1 P-loop containing nucleoside triphosphate hydrolase [Pseudocohnilembus persalinus]
MENIQVSARIRPINNNERNQLEVDLWKNEPQTNTISASQDSYNELIRLRKMIPGQKTTYTLDKTFDKTNSNQDIYENIVKKISLSSLQGINGTVFMYGQTGSGKTYTMMGTKYQQMIQRQQNNYSNANSHRKQRNKSQETKKIYPIIHRKQFSSKSPNSHGQGSDICFSEYNTQRLQNFNKNENQDNSPTKNQILSKNSQRDEHDKNFANQNEDGILVKALADLFEQIEQAKQQDKQYYLKCSYVEIYTDFVYDLLKERDQLSETCSINEDQNKEFFIKGAKEEVLTNIDDILQLLYKGEQNRHYASTAMNHVSSRSHTIFRLYVRSIPKVFNNQQKEGITESVLNFVDLAGSEKIVNHNFSKTRNNSGSIGNHLMQTQLKERQNESKNINKSLFFLTQVISLKSQGKPDIMIPFRNSPLTKILRSSLGGNSRTAIILCINPCASQIEQSLSTLRFGLCAKKIQNQVSQNIVYDNNPDIMKGLIEEYEKRIHDMEGEKQNSKNLLNIIERLNEQKNSLISRLSQAKKEIKSKQGQLNIGILNRDYMGDQRQSISISQNEMFYDAIHYDNIGIVSVFQKLQDKVKQDSQIMSQIQNQNNQENKDYMLKALKNINDQKSILMEKNIILEKKIEELKHVNNQIRLGKENKKKNSENQTDIQHLEDENMKLKQIVTFYQNRNLPGLKALNVQTLNLLEESVLTLLDNIKTQKNFQLFKAISEQNHTNLSNIEQVQDVVTFKIADQNIQFPQKFYECTMTRVYILKI